MTFDFTSMRLGKLAGPYKRKIIVCPKCGRKGTDDGVISTKPYTAKTGFEIRSCTHVCQSGRLLGLLPFFGSHDSCSYTVSVAKSQGVKLHG